MIYPIVTPLASNPKLWELRGLFQFNTRFGLLRIMPGFITDGASIPRLPGFWFLIGHPMQGDVLPAAVLHDGLYSAKLLTRKQADLVLLETMIKYKVNRIKARIIWTAVRLFGWFPWLTRKHAIVKRSRTFVRLYSVSA